MSFLARGALASPLITPFSSRKGVHPIHAQSDDHSTDVRALTPTGHLVLGMVALFGPTTSYQLERRVAATVGSFWVFPHSQLYAEPRKLAEAGLLEETTEPSGRKRRTYSMTEAGRAALAMWFAEPETGRTEARDPGLLKLFFADLAEPDDVSRLAERQARAHRARARELAAKRRQLAANVGPHTLATLKLGARYASTSADFWEQLAGGSGDDD